MHRIRSSVVVLATAAVLWPLHATAQTTVYRCPGNVYTSSADISAKEAEAKGCKTIEGAPITVIQGTRPRIGSLAPASGPRPADSKVEPAQQRARDGDARRILEGELKKEEELLEQMRKEFNNGEPERRGDERNFQKYQERVAEMKAAIARKESDIAAIKREISKLPAS